MPKDFSIETVDHLANLSMISLTENEKIKLSNELNVIIDAVKKVSELDLKNVKSSTNPILLENIYRDDIKKNSIPTDLVLKNAHNIQNNQFKVSKIS